MDGYLQIQSIDKIFGNIQALDSVTLNVEKGEIVAIIGINGSGKTTLLRILAGLEEPSKGNILFDKKSMKLLELREISTLVFQKTVMFNTNVYDNIAFGLKIRGLSKKEIEKRVLSALTSVGLINFVKRKAKKLSGGEQQRIALSRAFVIEPEILLLDEPTANLDPNSAIIIEKVIKKMREKEACTIIMATHNLHQAKRLADKIVHIHQGRVIEFAGTDTFFSQPSNPVTRSFISGELQF